MHLQIKTDKNKVAGSLESLLSFFTLIKIIKK
jgi:hypothetical protein